MGLGNPTIFSPDPYNDTHVSLSAFSDPYAPPPTILDPIPNTAVLLNSSILKRFSYTVYSNATLSNYTDCHLLFPTFWKPSLDIRLLDNGTFTNVTSCDIPLYPIAGRSTAALTFAVLFAVTIVLSLVNLKKHGASHLPHSERFRLVGRRWPWYWALATATFATISGFTGIDVDRVYTQSLAIILQVFFYYLMSLASSAMVWESVRHWGSWRERQLIEADIYAVKQEHKTLRAREEFFLPLVFYAFWWLSFFMVIPRGWGAVSEQRSDSQQAAGAQGLATDGRFKASAVFGILGWLVIVYHLRHTVHYYCIRHAKVALEGGGVAPGRGLGHVPLKHIVTLFLLLVRLAQDLLASIDFTYSFIRWGGRIAPLADRRFIWPFCFGFLPVLLIVVTLNIYGLIQKNEDRVIIRERSARGRELDRSLGVGQERGWWENSHGHDGGFSGSTMDADDRLKALANAGPAGDRRREEEQLEMRDLKGAHNHSPVAGEAAPSSVPAVEGISVQAGHAASAGLQEEIGSGEAPPPYRPRYKSMLDV